MPHLGSYPCSSHAATLPYKTARTHRPRHYLSHFDATVLTPFYSQAMDFDPDDNDDRRLEIREWLSSNGNNHTRGACFRRYVAPHWPKPYGLDADPIHQLIIDEELSKAGVKRAAGGIGLGWAGPTILYGGTPEQQNRYLWPV